MSEGNGTSLSPAVLKTRLDGLEKFLERIDRASDNFVSKAEFDPVKRLVYGLVSVILLAVAGALVGLVVTGSTG